MREKNEGEQGVPLSLSLLLLVLFLRFVTKVVDSRVQIPTFSCDIQPLASSSSLKNLAVNNVTFQAAPASKAGQEICDQSLELSFPCYSFP